MSDEENEISLDYDMWEGQFEFIGSDGLRALNGVKKNSVRNP